MRESFVRFRFRKPPPFTLVMVEVNNESSRLKYTVESIVRQACCEEYDKGHYPRLPLNFDLFASHATLSLLPFNWPFLAPRPLSVLRLAWL